MRKIIINRLKSVVGCAGKINIYSIDKIEKDTIITKEMCAYLGSIKNGMNLEAEIPEKEIAIIAAYDNLGVFMITDILVIPNGCEDIILYGKTKLNPFKGNPFKFI